VSDLQSEIRWDAADLNHFMGVLIDDREAVQGTALINAHALSYGPYISLPLVGNYIATFRLKTDETLNSDDIATLDVFAHDGLFDDHRGHKSFGCMGLARQSFNEQGTYQEFSIPFFYDGAQQMEFRVLSYQISENAVTLDRVIVQKVE